MVRDNLYIILVVGSASSALGYSIENIKYGYRRYL
jgi:hypothetical protein